MDCVNCGNEAEDTFIVTLGNGVRIEDVPLCAYCWGLTETESQGANSKMKN